MGEGMNMKGSKFTIGSLMLLVAVIGILTWLGVSIYRGWKMVPMYRYRARFHARHEKSSIVAVREPTHIAGPDELAVLTRVWQEYHSAMKRKYERAATYPWLFLDNDPPNPVELSNAAKGREVDLLYH